MSSSPSPSSPSPSSRPPNFSRPLPSASPYNNMGAPSRQPRATSAARVAARHGVPPRTSSACQGGLEVEAPAASTRGQTVEMDAADPLPNNGRPIMNFRPSLWKHLDTKRDKLSINVFWPKKIEDLEDEEYDEEAHKFPYEAMKPLNNFRNLRILTLAGMERSYQRIIWQTVFQNPELQELTLEMAFSPVVIVDMLPKCIKVTKDWIFPIQIPGWASITYLGDEGKGELREGFGCGEYLDQQAMKMAHDDTFGTEDKELHLLGISKLVLMGFVIDASPFFRWFDSNKLRNIILKDNCFDAGFVLPPAMREKTEVLLGGGLIEKPQMIPGQVIQAGEAKIVTLRKGKVVDKQAVEVVQKPQQGGQLKKKFSGVFKKWQHGSREDKITDTEDTEAEQEKEETK